jgi:hypothetical protein
MAEAQQAAPAPRVYAIKVKGAQRAELLGRIQKLQVAEAALQRDGAADKARQTKGDAAVPDTKRAFAAGKREEAEGAAAPEAEKSGKAKEVVEAPAASEEESVIYIRIEAE